MMWKTYPQQLWKILSASSKLWNMRKTYPHLLWITPNKSNTVNIVENLSPLIVDKFLSFGLMWNMWKSYPHLVGITL